MNSNSVAGVKDTSLLGHCLLASDDTNDETNSALVTLIRLMGKTGVCTNLLDEQVLCKVLDCSIKILMHREFIDVLLPWVSRIVHDAASSLQSATGQSIKHNKPQKLLSLDQLSNLFECLLALLKEPEPLSDNDGNGFMTTDELRRNEADL